MYIYIRIISIFLTSCSDLCLACRIQDDVTSKIMLWIPFSLCSSPQGLDSQLSQVKLKSFLFRLRWVDIPRFGERSRRKQCYHYWCFSMQLNGIIGLVELIGFTFPSFYGSRNTPNWADVQIPSIFQFLIIVCSCLFFYLLG